MKGCCRLEPRLKSISIFSICQAASQKEYKKFLNSVNHIREYLADIRDREEKLNARMNYRKAMADAIREATLNGIVIKFKCGKVMVL